MEGKERDRKEGKRRGRVDIAWPDI